MSESTGELHDSLWYAAICFTNVISMACCIRLLSRLRHLHEQVARSTFLQVLRLLTFADIFMHLTLLVVTLIVPSNWGITKFLEDFASLSLSSNCTLANLVLGAFSIFRLISVFLESNIALLFMAQALRWHNLLENWRRTTYACILLGAVLGVLKTVLAGLIHLPGRRSGPSHACKASSQDHITMYSLLAAALLALGAYFITLYRSLRASPGSVQQASLRRAANYPANFLISFGVFIYCLIFKVEESSDLTYLAVCLESSNGMFNTATYIWQSRYAAQLRAAAPGGPYHQRALSFNVAIGEVEIVEIPENISNENVNWGYRPEEDTRHCFQQ